MLPTAPLMLLATKNLIEPSLMHPFWIFDWQEVASPHVLFCSIALFFSGILCSAAGIGGGGVYVAVLMVVGRLSPHDAVPLSKAVVFFGAMASLVVNLRRSWAPQSQESASKTVINFHACRVVVPAALLGTFTGVALNVHAEGRTIVVLLTLVLCFMTVMVCRTAWQQRSRELLMQLEAEGREPLLPNASADGAAGPPHVPSYGASASKLEARDAPEAATKEDMAFGILLLFVVVVCGVLHFHMQACVAEQDGHGVVGACQHPLIERVFAGQMEAWLSSASTAALLDAAVKTVPCVFCIVMSMYYGRNAYQLAAWTFPTVLTYQCMAITTGALAGLVGVGGGLIFAPFFLFMGMNAAVAVATSSTCVLFTSSSTTIQYLLTDRVIMTLALVYGIVTLVASWLGTSLVHRLQDSFQGRQSYITMIVAVAVGLSAVVSLQKFFEIGATTA